MVLECLNLPMVEPVSVKDLKAYLRLETDQEDGLLESFLQAARESIEQYTGKSLMKRSWRLRFPLSECRRRVLLTKFLLGVTEIIIPLQPVTQIQKVTYKSSYGKETALTGYKLQNAEGRAKIIFGKPLPSEGEIEILFEAGYAAHPRGIPASLCQGILMIAAEWFEERGRLSERKSQGGGLPDHVLALVSPYRLRSVA